MARTNRRSLEANAPVVGKVNLMTQFCFATDIRRPERLISGNRNVPRRVEERGQVPKGCGLSSLAIELVQSGHLDKISSLRAFMGTSRPKGAVINKHAGHRAQTGCGRIGRGTGENSEILWRPEKGH